MTAPEPEIRPAPEITTVAVAEGMAGITPEAAQPKLGELEAPEKRTGIDEDLLDIPAFLRRQAN